MPHGFGALVRRSLAWSFRQRASQYFVRVRFGQPWRAQGLRRASRLHSSEQWRLRGRAGLLLHCAQSRGVPRGARLAP